MTTAWTPTASVTGHTGEPLPANLEFFASPPPEIGELQSAYSTLQTGKKSVRMDWSVVSTDLFSAFGVAIFVGLGVGFVASLILGPSMPYPQGRTVGTWMGIVAGVLAFAYNMRSGFFQPVECTYVGEHGVALFAKKGDGKDAKTGSRTFLFRDAASVRVSTTRQYINNAYQSTACITAWHDDTNNLVYGITSAHNSESNNPPPDNRFHFAAAAERQWTAFAMKRAQTTLAQRGEIEFPLPNGDKIVLGNGYVDIHQKQQQHRVNLKDIDRLGIQNGTVTILLKDAKAGFFGLGSSGIYSFKYADIANANLFLLLFDALVKAEFVA